MSGNLAGKVAIVTGGGGGIGSATGERLARAGAAVALADLHLDAAEAAAERLRGQGFTARAFRTDMESVDSIRTLAADTMAAFGRIDILHNNAVLNDPVIYPQDTTLADMNVEHWDKIFAVNTRGPMLMSQAVIPHMIAQGGGVIINMSSGASTKGLPDMLTAYGASKGALNTLTLYSAAQLGKHNIRVNALVCGAILTPSLQKLFTKEQVTAMESSNLLGRSTMAEDVANLVCFLASDEARQITGQLYPI
ncbi:MAG TPA: SDR family oxidoreductase [Sphingobium sp.]|nr:SDR family oxidoreductase [Sphingobium sp.]